MFYLRYGISVVIFVSYVCCILGIYISILIILFCGHILRAIGLAQSKTVRACRKRDDHSVDRFFFSFLLALCNVICLKVVVVKYDVVASTVYLYMFYGAFRAVCEI